MPNISRTAYNGVAYTYKGQCHEIFECWFFHQKAHLLPLEVPWDDCIFCRRFTEILNKKSAQWCVIHRGMATRRSKIHQVGLF